MARRTKEAALETRNRILDTAEQLFLERGVSRTSLEMIAAAAGLTRGAIYWHFRNKADLFDAMMARVVLPMEEMAARAAQEDPSDPLDHVRDCALNVLDHLMTDPRCRRVFEICCHKVEYVDEMMGVRQRQIEARNCSTWNAACAMQPARDCWRRRWNRGGRPWGCMPWSTDSS
jgi:TetR/AcrR family acrAB operon transcriptional repressor